MQPLIWLGILALLLVVEAITAGLTTIWFAGGALIAFCAGLVGFGLGVQVGTFIVVSLLRRTGRCYCMLCRSEPHCTDIAVSVCFIGTSHLYQTTGNEVLQQRNHTDQCKQSDWKESSCDSGD